MLVGFYGHSQQQSKNNIKKHAFMVKKTYVTMNSKGHCNPKKQDKVKTLERMNGNMKNLDIYTLY